MSGRHTALELFCRAWALHQSAYVTSIFYALACAQACSAPSLPRPSSCWVWPRIAPCRHLTMLKHIRTHYERSDPQASAVGEPRVRPYTQHASH